ncbi:helix-turn-helix domain-containing protein [Amycolatopsis magusensis]|uniref:helix-turn-helix domain-containing protein n=1 Tax=Amycolatopsis magusensis TaxID=882444 RepID=UPI003794EB62
MTTMLEHLRNTARLGQRELAARAKVAQETISQLETGKSARPRLDTLTKLRDALELGDLRPEDLLEPSPLSTDPNLDSAATTLITLLKVLPAYREDDSRRNEFWWALSGHLGYQDLYPATSLAAALEATLEERYSTAATDLAEYVLMFFDPDDDGTIGILTREVGLGPGRQSARFWCRDITTAAWTLHRAAMTSYPRQIGELVKEAIDTTDLHRRQELCGSVYAVVRSEAYRRASVEQQIAALRTDPSSDVHLVVAKTGNAEVQAVALEISTAWEGLSLNPAIDAGLAEQLVDKVLAGLTGGHAVHAAHALIKLAERPDLPRHLLDRISTAIDREDRPEVAGGWVTSALLAIRRTLRSLDADTKAPRNRAGSPSSPADARCPLRLVTDEDTHSTWWRRLLKP